MGANCKRQGSLSAGRVWGFPFHEGETDLVSKQTVLNLTMPASGWPMGEKYFKTMNIFSSSFLFHAVYALYMISVSVCVACVCVCAMPLHRCGNECGDLRLMLESSSCSSTFSWRQGLFIIPGAL